MPEGHAVGVTDAQGEPDSVSEALGEVEADAQALPDGEADFEHMAKGIIINSSKIECIVPFPIIGRRRRRYREAWRGTQRFGLGCRPPPC